MEKMKWIKKGISALLALNMVLSSVPLPVFAVTEDNLCDHHTEHTAECGYREGSPGSACTHEHSEDCYEILNCLHECGTECEQGCTHECTVENGCIIMELICHHVHGDCGYSEGTAEVPCGHVHNENCGYAEAVVGNPCANAETDPECDHLGSCGFVAAVEGAPCGHTACDDTCGYAPATEGTPCTHVCEVNVDSDDSCYKLLCSHADGGHDDACGYAEAVEAHECHYECAECANSDVIANQSADWCGNPLCSQEDVFHVTSCVQYVAPEDPQCFCAEKCTEPNVWCDICGFDVTGCTGEVKPAVGGRMAISSYSGDTVYVHLTLKAVDVSGNEVSTTFNSYIEQDGIDNREGYEADFYVGYTYCLSGFDIDGYTVKDEEITFTVYSSGNISINSGNASVEYGSDTTYIVIPVNCIGGDRVTIDCSTIDLNVYPYHAWGPGWYADGSVDLHELILTEPYIFMLENSESMTKDNVEYIRILGGAILNAGTLTDGVLVYAENGKIQSGTFTGQVNITADGEICGGTFNNIINRGIVSAGTFNGELTNYGTITNQGNIQLGEDFVLVQNGTVDCNAHIWRDGICRLCSVTCQHSWANGTCTACGTNCDHSGSTHTAVTDRGDGTHGYGCTVCGAAVTGEHTGGKATCTTPAVCDDCGASYGDLPDHNWENGECTYGCSTLHDPHNWKSGTCTVCGLVCTHESFENGTCTLCGISFMEGYGPDSDDSEFLSPIYVSGTAITSTNPSAGTSWSDETGTGNLNFRWGNGDELDVTAVTSDETVAYEKATVQPHLSDAHRMQFLLSAAYGEGTPVIAARGFDEYFHRDFMTHGTGSVANVFTQTASGDPGFLSGDMLMYGAAEIANGTASLEFQHIPATFRFIITNTHGEALTLDSVTLRVVDADGTPVAAASNACVITVEAGYGYQESFSGYGTYDAVTTNITGGTLEPGQSYIAYALALPLGKADNGAFNEAAFKDKTIQVTVTTFEGACIAFELAADKLAAANPGNKYNWVGGKSYTMRMGTRCADGCTFDAAGNCTLCGYDCDHNGAEYKDNGDGTHDKVCGECGYVEVDNEAHTPAENTTYTNNGNGTHSYTCTVCGDATEAHSFDENGTCVCGVNLFTVSGSTLTIDGTLGGKTEATEEDITVLVNKIKDCVDSGITTIIVTGNNQAKLLTDGYLTPVVSLAFEQLTYVYQDENIDSYWGTVDLIYQDVTEIVEYEFYVCDVLRSITLPKVTKVGDRGFWACYYLETLTFGSVVTDITDNSGEVFYDLGYKIGGCNLVLNCGQLNTATEYQPNLDTRIWWNTEWKSITLTHADDAAYTDNSDGTHSYTCSDCGTAATEEHSGGTATCTTQAVCDLCGTSYGELAAHTPDANGKCTVDGCGYQYAAKVGDSFYETIHKALRAAERINGCTLTLLDDVTLTSTSSYASYVNTGTFTLDLNGKTISSNKRTLEVMGSADLTIRDGIGSGKIVSTGGSAVYLSGGKLTIESGIFEGTLDGVFLSGTSTLIVKGGTFTGSRAMITGFGSDCVIDLTNIDPAGFTLKNNGSGTIAPKLPEGYGMVDSDGKLLTSLSAEQSATVHKHEYKYTDLGDGNHQQACSCGLTTGEPAAHSTTAEDDKAANCGSKAYCSVCESYYGEVDLTNHDENAEYENGFCLNCGAYQPATDSDSDGYYEIDNTGKLYWFAQQVNSGSTAINGELTADIKVNENVLTADGSLNGDGSNFRVWTPIGTEANAYTGEFRGSEHTVSGLYFNSRSADYVGLFGYVGSGGTVQNVGVIDSYFYAGSYVGGVAGCNRGTLQYVYNTGNVNGSRYAGGVTGENNYIVQYAYNTGTVFAMDYAGGVTGYNNYILQYAYNTGFAGGAAYYGGIAGGNRHTLKDCYYLADSETETDALDGTTAKTAGQFERGEVAYLLGSPFGQNIGTHLSPVLNLGYEVYEVHNCKNEVAYSNTNENIGHSYENGTCTVCGEACAHTGGEATCTTLAVCTVCGESYGDVDTTNHDETVAFNDNGFCPNGCYEPAVLNGEVYEISNAGQLYWFAQQVNGGNNTINAVLTADIDLENRPWTPVGTQNESVSPNVKVPYMGVFDGQGHVIKNLSIHVIDGREAGLFGRAQDATLLNFGVVDAAVVSDPVNGTGYRAGIVAGELHRCTVANVYSAGNLTVTTTHAQAGGIAGECADSTLTNCFTTYGCLTASNAALPTAVTNCYYLASSANADSAGTFKTGEQFESGEVAYLLGDTYGQTIGTDVTPNFNGAAVYYGYLSCADDAQPVYSNNGEASEEKPDHAGALTYENNAADGTHIGTYTCCGSTFTEEHTEGTAATCVSNPICSVCKYEYGEPSNSAHAFADDNETCKYCQQIIVARVNWDGVVSYYTDIQYVPRNPDIKITVRLTLLANHTVTGGNTGHKRLQYVLLERESDDITITVPNGVSLAVNQYVDWIDCEGVSYEENPRWGNERTYGEFSATRGAHGAYLRKDLTTESISRSGAFITVEKNATLTLTGASSISEELIVYGKLVLGENATLRNTGTTYLVNDIYQSVHDIPAGLTGGAVRINGITYTYVSGGSTDEKDHAPYWSCNSHVCADSKADCITRDHCDHCGDEFGELGGHTIDITTGNCVLCNEYIATATVTDGTTTLYADDGEKLGVAIKQLMDSGSRTITVDLPGYDMIHDVCDAVETAAEGELRTVHLTVKGLTMIGEDTGFARMTQLATLSLPDVTYLYEYALRYTELERLELTAEEEITVEREVIDSDIVGLVDLVLCCNKADEVSDGVYWKGFTFKSVTFTEHDFVDGVCTVCGEACEHIGGTATCTTLAVCDICGVSYGDLDPDNHTYESNVCCGYCGDPAVNGGKDVVWTLKDGKLTITGSGAMAEYTVDSRPWAAHAATITAVTIGEGVSCIGESAFYGCTALTEITIPGNVYGISDAAFGNCTALTKVTLEEGVATIGSTAFMGCTALTEVTIPASVKSIRIGAFDYCDALETVNVPCTWAANPLYTFADTVTVNIADHTHGTPVYSWTEDPTTLTVSVSCTACGETLTGSTTDMDVTTSDDGFTTTYTATVTLDGKEYTDSKVVSNEVTSVNITWGEMDFIYTDGTGWNNPDTAWVQVENTGNTSVSVTYTYDTERTDITGSFFDGTATVTAPVAIDTESTKKIWLRLDGKPGEALNNTTIGSVKLTIA